jgi:hypothetical protein
MSGHFRQRGEENEAKRRGLRYDRITKRFDTDRLSSL